MSASSSGIRISTVGAEIKIGGNNLRKELKQTKQKIAKLLDKKVLIDKQLEPLFIREEELENEEIIAICRKNNITIEELLKKLNNDKKTEVKSYENSEY